MPMWLHIVLATIFTGYFLYRFIKDRYVYELLFVIWIPSTLLPYVVNDPTIIRVIGIAQIVLFILVIYFMFRKRGAHRQKTLSMLAEMAADRLPTDDSDEDSTTVSDSPNPKENEIVKE